jgi:hypothetical protein
MRYVLMFAGALVTALVVWGSVVGDFGALWGNAGWWSLVALAWPCLIAYWLVRDRHTF